MVNSFDVQWYAARMIEELKDTETTKKALESYSGVYINSYSVPAELRDEIAEDFMNTHGAKAVPVSDQEDMEKIKKRGYKPVIVSQAKRDVILKSELYADIKAENDKERKKARPLYDRFCEFAEKIENRLEESEVTTLYEFLDEISELEEKEE